MLSAGPWGLHLGIERQSFECAPPLSDWQTMPKEKDKYMNQLA
jgi:hypothetical protein